MVEVAQARLGWQLKPWQTILLFNVLLMALTGLGTYFFDFFAG